MTAAATASSTEAGVLESWLRPDLSRRRYVLLLVEGLYPQGKRVPAYLSGCNSSVYSGCPWGVVGGKDRWPIYTAELFTIPCLSSVEINYLSRVS
ncbi:hypothetical protein AVEN_114284-1 [Araneus ventricosus]|uniref:Uncharacterized protein n=1 Tax=Araneus ventricosus TaxID=182803 RepID=A0A4Y2MP67_ARAVE|nr:hypothetical protein AVEN_114284-1 [Araneus ventricosus]